MYASDGGQSNIPITGDGGWNHITTVVHIRQQQSLGSYLILTVLQPFTLSTMDIYPSASIGTSFSIEAKVGSTSGTVFSSYSGVTSCARNSGNPTTAQTVQPNWALTPGTYYIGFTSNPSTWRSGLATHSYLGIAVLCINGLCAQPKLSVLFL
ncbi:MAG: hypothetical protein R2829_10005 [Bacteroidia bacterium]